MEVIETLRALEKASRGAEILVLYSGGKDSLVTMDLCAKVGPVKAIFWYTVPGLEVCEGQMRLCQERWGVKPMQVPDLRKLDEMRQGVWCDPPPELEKLPEWTLRMSIAYSLHLSGCGWVATGMKEADGYQRRLFFGNIRDSKDPIWQRVLHPLRPWSTKQVRDYLKANRIPLPPTPGGATSSGIGTDYQTITWLHDSHPEDFKTYLRWFPYAMAVIKRREWYGI